MPLPPLIKYLHILDAKFCSGIASSGSPLWLAPLNSPLSRCSLSQCVQVFAQFSFHRVLSLLGHKLVFISSC